ncbi:MAG: NAD-dependent epimerase/dehydratase family protein [Verrucomicrobia bacterium]|nr:NAD-dependent epimerase/dehydratase family protein [Cytophagales bacterium]
MKILVTGATGFLGKRLTERLLEEKNFSTIIATGRNKAVGKELASAGADFVAGDLENADFVHDIVKSADLIVHTAALSSPWGKYQDFYNANVLATKNLLAAARKSGIKRFINISTPSIYFNGKDRFNVKEIDDLPEKFSNYYAATKFEAEKLVTQAFAEGLETLSLRPRAIIGRGDFTIMPRLLKAQQSGKLRIIGNGKTIADLSSAANVVDAILLAIHAQPQALGKAYNITNGTPVKLWEYIDEVFKKLNLTLNHKKMPYYMALTLASGLEFISKISKSQQEPPLTKQGVGVLAKSCTLDISLARNLLGYQPKQSNDEAATEFVDWWKIQDDNTFTL